MTPIPSPTTNPSKPPINSDKVTKSEPHKETKTAPSVSKKDVGPKSKAIKNDWLTSIVSVQRSLQYVHQELDEISKEVDAILLEIKKLKQPDLKNNPDGDSSASESDDHGTNRSNQSAKKIHQVIAQTNLEFLQNHLKSAAKLSKSFAENYKKTINSKTKELKQISAQLDDNAINSLPKKLSDRTRKVKNRLENLYQNIEEADKKQKSDSAQTKMELRKNKKKKIIE